MTNGIGPKGSSMLNKLGLKHISELTNDELREMVSNDRGRRVLTRAAGRINRIAKGSKQASRPKLLPTLEAIGLATELITKLRSSGKSDTELIAMLKEKGII
jgi:hypothetical protein